MLPSILGVVLSLFSGFCTVFQLRFVLAFCPDSVVPSGLGFVLDHRQGMQDSGGNADKAHCCWTWLLNACGRYWTQGTLFLSLTHSKRSVGQDCM